MTDVASPASGKRVLLDTNVVVRLALEDTPDRSVAVEALKRLPGLGYTATVLTPKVETEFWAVATRPRVNSGLGFTPDETAAWFDAFAATHEFVDDVPAVHTTWRTLVRTYGVKGKPTHDAGHAAAVLAHGLDAILTFNVGDLARYRPTLVVLDPRDVAAGRLGPAAVP